MLGSERWERGDAASVDAQGDATYVYHLLQADAEELERSDMSLMLGYDGASFGVYR